jgi:hypothetical protein
LTLGTFLSHKIAQYGHEGAYLRVPEAQGSKLDRLTPIHIFNPAFSEEDHQRAGRELLAEMQREWENDWSGL